MERMDLSGETAVVTGGNRGIGAAVARGLVEAGARVAIVSRSPASGEQTAASLREAGGEARWLQGDTREYDQMQRVAAEVEQALGPVTIFIGSGSPTSPRPELFLDTEPTKYADYFTRQFSTRLVPFRALVDQMISQGRGKAVFISTDAGRVPTPSEALVGAGAAGLMFATRALARELGRYGIRVNTVSTTLTRDTPAYERFEDKANKDRVLTKAFSKIEQRAAFGLNAPEDVADAVLFFASASSDQISGATLSVNGGLSFP